jgi:hypothetical protein
MIHYTVSVLVLVSPELVEAVVPVSWTTDRCWVMCLKNFNVHETGIIVSEIQ